MSDETKQDKKERQDLTGALFKNDRKSKDNHPDYTGSVIVNGQEYWLSGWKKTNRNSETYVSLSLKAKTQADTKAGEEKTDF